MASPVVELPFSPAKNAPTPGTLLSASVTVCPDLNRLFRRIPVIVRVVSATGRENSDRQIVVAHKAKAFDASTTSVSSRVRLPFGGECLSHRRDANTKTGKERERMKLSGREIAIVFHLPVTFSYMLKFSLPRESISADAMPLLIP